MAKKIKNEDTQTYDAMNENAGNQNADSVNSNDDENGIRPLAADDYVENFGINGNTYAVRDAEAQDSITSLNNSLTNISDEVTELNSALLKIKTVTVSYDVSSSEINSVISLTVDHGLGNAYSGYCISRIVGDKNTNNITWFAMVSSTNLRFISTMDQTVSISIQYFYY